MYTTFNVYDIGQGEYEGVLRWGKSDGTSLGGSTLAFPIGNKIAVEYYIGHFKGFYGMTHSLISDNAAEPSKSGVISKFLSLCFNNL